MTTKPKAPWATKTSCSTSDLCSSHLGFEESIDWHQGGWVFTLFTWKKNWPWLFRLESCGIFWFISFLNVSQILEGFPYFRDPTWMLFQWRWCVFTTATVAGSIHICFVPRKFPLGAWSKCWNTSLLVHQKLEKTYENSWNSPKYHWFPNEICKHTFGHSKLLGSQPLPTPGPHPGSRSNFSLMPALGGWLVTITHGYLNGRRNWVVDPNISGYLSFFHSVVCL